MGGLTKLLDELAHELGDRETRQRAADTALEIANSVPGADAPAGSASAASVTGVRLVATDVMVFAGATLDDSFEAVRAGVFERRLAAPAPPSGGGSAGSSGASSPGDPSAGEAKKFVERRLRR